MKLNFEIVNSYTNGANMNFVHEPNNLFTKYYMSNPFVLNESVIQFIGDDYEPLNYNNLPFQNETNRLTAEAIEKFGVKELPEFGSYGWFTELYTNKNYILAPINATPFQYPFPTIDIIKNGPTIEITITDPDDVAYDAYRLIFREGYFATEFITYEKSISIDSLYNGEYQLSILGYRVDGVTSIESKQTTVIITEGADAPEGGSSYGI